MVDYPDETDKCLDEKCAGKYKMDYPDKSCSCHINPPCGRCTSSFLVCDICGAMPEEIDPSLAE